MANSISAVSQAKENYYKLHKAADDAEAAYQKKKGEPTAKQKDVDKLSKKSVEAKEKAQNADVAYKKVLEKANEHQSNFYSTYMPKLLEVYLPPRLRSSGPCLLFEGLMICHN